MERAGVLIRVLIVSQYFWPENFKINDVVRSLDKGKFHVTVITGKPNYPAGKIYPEYKAKPDEFLKYFDVEIIRVPTLPRGNGNFFLLLNYLFFTLSLAVIGGARIRKRKFDIVFVNQLSPIFVGYPAALFKWMNNARMVMWVFDLWPETLFAMGVPKSRFSRWFFKKLFAPIYMSCDLVLCQSLAFLEPIRKKIPTGCELAYLPSWPEPHPPASNPNSATLTDKKSSEFLIGFAGNMGSAQDFDTIFLAMKLLAKKPQIKWLFVGDGSAKSSFQDAIVCAGLEDRVRFAGWVSKEEVANILSAADALLVPLQDSEAYNMTIPAKVQYYMSLGKPILGSLNGEGARVITEANCGLVANASDFSGLAANISSLLDAPTAFLEKLGSNGKLYCDQHFSPTKSLRTIERHLASINDK